MNSEPSSKLKRKYDTSDSTPSKSCKRMYDVFLSFRGEDTRKGFVSHLYDALDRSGVYTYKDDVRIQKGTSMAPELVKAIEESRSAIVVLSRNYASSTWCLEELLHILKCSQKKDNDYKVFPVFYDVEPTEVRKQIGDFGKGFDNTKEKESKIEEWRKALQEISNKGGWDIKNDNRTEAELITDIVKEVSIVVPPNTLSIVGKDYVGMDVRLNELNQLLDLGSKKVLVVGIWGMGGIGKTTIAQFIFELICQNFKSRCFVNVKETLKRKDLCYIQKILHKGLLKSSVSIQNSVGGKITLMDRLCGRKVFIVLDDVHRSEDLECLIGEGKSRYRWFGEGSRIIITTRDKHFLKANGVDHIYEAPRLSFDEPHQLLLQKAFKGNFPSSIEEYRGAIEGIVRYANGHPLALKVLGSSLHGRNVNEWMDTLVQLKKHPDEEILGSLKVSFDALNKTEKEIFLDICLFNNLHYPVEEMLRSFGSNVDISISNLESKSLITTEHYGFKKLGMHDLLSEIGMHIIIQESPNNPGKRSRVWDFNDVQEVLTNNKGTEAVEVIRHLYRVSSSPLRWNVDSLSKMPNLKCLISQGAIIEFPRRPCMVLKKLTIIDLKGSEIICDSIDFNIVPNLQRLYLSHCRKLRKLDQSVGCLKQLVHLALRGTDIENLPSSISSLTSLQTLDLLGSKCHLPEDIGNLKSLVKIIAGYSTTIWKLPSSVVHLSNLKELDLFNCRGLQLPNSLSGLCSLVILDLSGCGLGDGAIPDDIVNLCSLKELRLSANKFVSIPETISQLSQLTSLGIFDCKNLRYLPKHPFSLEIDTRYCGLLARYSGIWNKGDQTTVSLMKYRKLEDEYQVKNEIPCYEDSIEVYNGLIWDHILYGHLFKIIWPLFVIPTCFRCRESYVKIELSTSTSASNMYGYALCVVYEVLELDDSCLTSESTHVRKDFLCYFNSDQGPFKQPLEFDILMSKRAGLYGLLMYIPKDWFVDQLNGASFLQASVDSMNGSHVRVKACKADLISNGSTCFDYFSNELLLKPDSIFMTNSQYIFYQGT